MKMNQNEEVTRTLIFDANDRQYRFETDDEMQERTTKAKLGDPHRGSSWKKLVILEMNQYNDSWDQIQELHVEVARYGVEDEEEEFLDPNKIKEQFGIEWYDVLHQFYRWDPTEECRFHIWTKYVKYTLLLVQI